MKHLGCKVQETENPQKLLNCRRKGKNQGQISNCVWAKPANAEDTRDLGSITRLGRSPG